MCPWGNIAIISFSSIKKTRYLDSESFRIFFLTSEALFFDVEVFHESLYKYGFHNWVLKGIAELKESNLIQTLSKKLNSSGIVSKMQCLGSKI